MSNKYLQFIKEYIIVALACVVMAFNINYFFVGNKLAEGGVSGLSLIIHYLSNIDVSYLYFALNIPLIILAYIFLGKNFLLKTFFATFVLSVFLKVFASFSEPLDDILLAAIFGGAINGIAIGIVFYAGGSTGGMDIVAKIVNKYTGIPISRILLATDFIVLSIVAVIFGKVIFMYTLISLVISSKMIDIIQVGIYSAKGVTIITTKEDEIRKRIMEDTGRGITLIDAKGGYTQKEIGMLYCVVGQYQLIKVKTIVKEVDPSAFMIVADVHEVIGNGFLVNK
ncbi:MULTISPECIES: YitT family protein [Fusobacterium]|jgi:yitT family protein|uniref:Membrane protein n=1 Tax=Fusobacterium pseudoperiodonticum TaxID=2663009 RepID=A0A2D3NU70_9FUSO|nr:YitT family protein [Fusobacterium pseudoperiodonticum]MBF0991649.1 YitT family protein [Fusobacterium sp.]MBF1207790.1 YitT family protein [Fusobacterium periodonticum]ATV58937.1 membrane protein [Fusobacterium pseudoperiodonticum]MBF1218855.1 YitT family protein [Fusobacterium periodonticum]MDU2236083.1 YitT family protein [Fusobacterium periodonticum]